MGEAIAEHPRTNGSAPRQEPGDVDPPKRESIWALLRRRRRGLGRYRGIQYWLRVRGYYILWGFLGLFVLNAVFIGGREAYDVTVQIDSPWDTEVPWLALPLSLAGWLVVTGFAGAVAGYVVSEVTDNRSIRRMQRGARIARIRHIPLLARLQYSRTGFSVPDYFPIRFVLRHKGDWGTAQDHWERVVERFLEAAETGRRVGPRMAMWEAVVDASYVLDEMSKRCPECQRAGGPAQREVTGSDAG